VTPRRRLLLLTALAAAALLACGSDGRPAATVDGTEITQQQVVDELEAIRGNDTYVAAIEGTGQTVLGAEDDAFDSAFVAEQLAVRVQYAIVGNEVDARGLEVDDECRSAARDSLLARLAGASPEGDGEAVLAGFAQPYQDYLVEREADFLVLQGDLSEQPCVADDAVGAYFEEHRDEFAQACSAHILLDTPEEADEVVVLLEGGADFAALAAERSIDTGSAQAGGELPCVTRGQFLPEFEEALFTQAIGEIGDPVQTSAGYHVIRVDSRDEPELGDVREQVAQALAAEVESTFNEWFIDAVAAADVEIDPRYGTWDPTSARIDRPAIEASTTTSTAPLPAEG
jgi:foldase protein PrsA